jgi:hypothetical protein
MFCNHGNQSRSSALAIALADELHVSKRKVDAVMSEAVAGAEARTQDRTQRWSSCSSEVHVLIAESSPSHRSERLAPIIDAI